MTGGPIKKPIKLIVDTEANAAPADIEVDFPANPYTIGTTEDTPKPTSKKPIVLPGIDGNSTAVNNPAEMIYPLNCSIRFTPNLVTSQSPINLPAAIEPVKATKPIVVNALGASTTF